MRWAGAHVTLLYAPELGRWLVLSHNDGELELEPLDTPGINLARLGTNGRLWVNRKDVTRQPDQKETLY